VAEPFPPTVEWCDGHIRIIDQRRLPDALELIDLTSIDQLCDAIRTLAVRGAPALGAIGAMGVALAERTGVDRADAAARLRATRPTAVNLAWGIERALSATDPAAEAMRIAAEDVARNRAIGAHGAPLVPLGGQVLTHCNAGALACVGYGTALGVIRAAWDAGRLASVWVGETRPVLQGARLTAWELQQLGIPLRVITDSMAASVMRSGAVDCVVVGADRIARNGDVANKIGTYGLAVLAAHHGIPLYVAAPRSTIDPGCGSGDAIVIEQRPAGEIAVVGTRRVVPEGVEVHNPAFDVTPASLISGIVTEVGVMRPPYALGRVEPASVIADAAVHDRGRVPGA